MKIIFSVDPQIMNQSKLNKIILNDGNWTVGANVLTCHDGDIIIEIGTDHIKFWRVSGNPRTMFLQNADLHVIACYSANVRVSEDSLSLDNVEILAFGTSNVFLQYGICKDLTIKTYQDSKVKGDLCCNYLHIFSSGQSCVEDFYCLIKFNIKVMHSASVKNLLCGSKTKFKIAKKDDAQIEYFRHQGTS
jgi:hypothetical protein